MKILLVMPPDINTVLMEAPNEVYEEFGAYPPLGLMYLAACIRKFSKQKHDIRIVDCDTDKLDFKALEKEIKGYAPDVVGVTAYTPIIYDSWQTLKLAKKINKKIITVIGGHHSDIYPKETINLGGIDYIVLGEGEYIFPKLIDALEKKQDPKKVEGIVFKKNGKIIITGNPGFVENLDELPLPARDLVDWRKHQCVLGKENVVATIMSSRGCPYRCTFCYKPLKARAWRFRSAENIVKEVEQCYKLGIREIFFFDDNFSVDVRRVKAICDEIVKRKLKISWSFRGRVNTLDYDMLVKCKKAGCHRIHFGVETGSDEGLRKIKKDITTEQIRKAFKLCKKTGIVAVANFMIGLPGEKKREMFNTVDFANSIDADYAEFAIVTPYPQTELYEEGLKRKIFKTDFWKEFAKRPYPGFELQVWNEYYSREELFKILEECLHRFYFNPMRMLKIAFSIRSFKEFKTKLKSGLTLLNYKKMKMPKKGVVNEYQGI